MKRIGASLLVILLAFGIYSNIFTGNRSTYAILPEKIDLDKTLLTQDSDNKHKTGKR